MDPLPHDEPHNAESKDSADLRNAELGNSADSSKSRSSDAIEEVEKPSSWKKPLIVIAALFLLLVMVLSIVPWYSVSSNPPPDMDVISEFELTSAEKSKLEAVEYAPTSSIKGAINQVDIFDYRTISTRLVSSACSSPSDSCYAKAIYYYVQDLNYVSDPKTRQYVQSPAETLLAGAGDCEDMSLLAAVMVESIGVDADIGVTYDHAFVRVQASDSFFGSDDDYTWIDPTSNDDFGEIGFINSDVVGWYEVV